MLVCNSNYWTKERKLLRCLDVCTVVQSNTFYVRSDPGYCSVLSDNRYWMNKRNGIVSVRRLSKKGGIGYAVL